MSFSKGTNNNDNTLWVESYRPTELNGYVGNVHLKERIQTYLAKGDIPHLLFFGKAGTGKTTLAKLIVNKIDCDHIIINASDENNVDTVRTKVKGFVSTLGYKDLKVIVLDEVDYMSPNAQAILRNLMETFSKNSRFILTCNYIERVIDPIQSRCQTFQITPPTKKDVSVQVAKILQLENVTFEQDILNNIIDFSYPDIRKIINTCQQSSGKGELKLDVGDIVVASIKGEIIDILKSNDNKQDKYLKARKTIANARIQDFSELYTHLYEKVDDYASQNPMSVIHLISEGQYKDALVMDKEIVFISTFIHIIDEVL